LRTECGLKGDHLKKGEKAIAFRTRREGAIVFWNEKRSCDRFLEWGELEGDRFLEWGELEGDRFLE